MRSRSESRALPDEMSAASASPSGPPVVHRPWSGSLLRMSTADGDLVDCVGCAAVQLLEGTQRRLQLHLECGGLLVEARLRDDVGAWVSRVAPGWDDAAVVVDGEPGADRVVCDADHGASRGDQCGRRGTKCLDLFGDRVVDSTADDPIAPRARRCGRGSIALPRAERVVDVAVDLVGCLAERAVGGFDTVGC